MATPFPWSAVLPTMWKNWIEHDYLLETQAQEATALTRQWRIAQPQRACLAWRSPKLMNSAVEPSSTMSRHRSSICNRLSGRVLASDTGDWVNITIWNLYGTSPVRSGQKLWAGSGRSFPFGSYKNLGNLGFSPVPSSLWCLTYPQLFPWIRNATTARNCSNSRLGLQAYWMIIRM